MRFFAKRLFCSLEVSKYVGFSSGSSHQRKR
jgi:hypothetical protein